MRMGSTRWFQEVQAMGSFTQPFLEGQLQQDLLNKRQPGFFLVPWMHFFLDINSHQSTSKRRKTPPSYNTPHSSSPGQHHGIICTSLIWKKKLTGNSQLSIQENQRFRWSKSPSFGINFSELSAHGPMSSSEGFHQTWPRCLNPKSPICHVIAIFRRKLRCLNRCLKASELSWLVLSAVNSSEFFHKLRYTSMSWNVRCADRNLMLAKKSLEQFLLGIFNKKPRTTVFNTCLPPFRSHARKTMQTAVFFFWQSPRPSWTARGKWMISPV